MPDHRLTDMEEKLHERDGQLHAIRQDYKRLLKKNKILSDNLNALAALRGQDKMSARPVRTSKRSSNHSIPIIAWSDWHVAELVSSSKTNGRNKYSPEIAQARAKENTESTLKLINMARRNTNIDEAILLLLGDFITGYLHEELAQTNCMGPVEEAYFAQRVLEQEIATFIEHSKLKRVRIVALRGNHGRTTRKVQFKNDYETSYETWIYWNLRDRISQKNIEWVIPESDIHYTELYSGCYLRSMHGHQVKYGGGIGGVSVPLNRWIAKQDQTSVAMTTVLGHFHTFSPASRFGINGSLKGWDEFAQSKGFAFEHPCQLLQMFDCSRRQVTARFPIFCE